MRVLVLGGSGFLGRHVVAALRARGHRVVIGSRHEGPKSGRRLDPARDCEWRALPFASLRSQQQWDDAVAGIDVVANCVGILRERGHDTYEGVHHFAAGELARACTRARTRRLVHVSALGLHEGARSRFILSKLRGERVVLAGCGASTIVRPSLLDGRGGYGARWIRALSRLPVHIVPADALGRIAVLDVGDAGEAIAALCEDPPEVGPRQVELGGADARTLAEHLAALRRAHCTSTARCMRLPAPLARLTSHGCDLLHLSPFSFGHLELLRRDNVPATNQLPLLLGRPPRQIGIDVGNAVDSSAVTAAA